MSDQNGHLWKLFIDGNEEAFKKLMEQHFMQLFNYGTKFSNDEELVKDTIQELFILLWDRKENLSIDVNPKAYLISSLRRALHRKIQSQNHFIRYSDLKDNINYFNFQVSVEDNMIEDEITKARAKRIAENITGLPERQKEVVYLKFFEEMSRDEISETMGITPQTVSNMLQIALKKLRTELISSLVFFLTFLNNKQNLHRTL